MIYLVYAVHTIVCIFLILVVLLQQGKGADLSVFGGGSTQTAFGARGAATVLHKLTVASFVIFILTTLGIAVLKGGGASATVMSEVEESQTDEQQPATGEQPAEAAPAAGETAAPATPDAAATDGGETGDASSATTGEGSSESGDDGGGSP